MIKLSVPSEDQKVLGTQKNCKRMHFMLYEEGATASIKSVGNLIETEDRIAADERFEGLSSNDALEIYKVLSDQLIRTHIYAAHIGSGISSRIAMSILSSGSFLL